MNKYLSVSFVQLYNSRLDHAQESAVFAVFVGRKFRLMTVAALPGCWLLELSVT